MTAVPPGTTLPWRPEDLPEEADVLARRWSYVVLEEIVDERALLRRWPWPLVDQRGRLVWPGEAEHDTDAATVDVDVLRAQLYLPNGLARAPRIGDVFAVRNADERGWRNRHVTDVRELIAGHVYDVSADAREAAKIAYASSLGTVAPAETADPDRQLGVAAVRSRVATPLPRLRVAAPPLRGASR